MNQFIGCDAHKRFCVFAVMKENGEYEPVEQVSFRPVGDASISARPAAWQRDRGGGRRDLLLVSG
jgi:hypothetical protein